MANRSEASFLAGGLQIKCDEETLTKLRLALCQDPDLAHAVGFLKDTASVRRICITRPAKEAPSTRPRWVVLFVIVRVLVFGAAGGTALIVGMVTTVRWLLNR